MNIFQKLIENGHFETLFPHFFASAPKVNYQRERLCTADDDFLDLDWLKVGSSTLAIVSHGLESSSNAKYVRSIGAFLASKNMDILAWNYRGCSGEINKSIKYYHSGATYDLAEVVSHSLAFDEYKSIILIGFSLGGNLTLKYMGEQGDGLDSRVKASIAISAPVCLSSSSHKLKYGLNKIYTNNFLKTLKQKVHAKKEQLKKVGVDISRIDKIKSLPEFDDVFTGPMHGFKNAADYYTKCSAKYYLKSINRPSLILNALNDPFLSKECFPFEAAKNNPLIELISSSRGGHVGFKNLVYNKHKGFEAIIYAFLNDGSFLK